MVRSSGSSPVWYPATIKVLAQGYANGLPAGMRQAIVITPLPVPQESTLPMRSLYGGFETIDRKTPSAMVDRQMLPRHTNSTDTFSGIFSL